MVEWLSRETWQAAGVDDVIELIEEEEADWDDREEEEEDLEDEF